MNAPRTHGYGQSPVSGDPREVEAALLARLTARLISAEARGQAGFPDLAAAIADNRRFWTDCASDLAGDGNGLPADLRARLLSLAGFVVAHSSRVLDGSAPVGALVEINRAIVAGLAPAERAA